MSQIAIEFMFVDFSASGGVSQESTSVATLLTCIRGYVLPPGSITIVLKSHFLPPALSSDSECTVLLSVALTHSMSTASVARGQRDPYLSCFRCQALLAVAKNIHSVRKWYVVFSLARPDVPGKGNVWSLLPAFRDSMEFHSRDVTS